jgi:hypothetical protein
MDIRQWDPSPAAATRNRRRPRLHPAGADGEIQDGPGTAGATATGPVTARRAVAGRALADRAAVLPQAGGTPCAPRGKPGLAKSSRVGWLGTRSPRQDGFAPPVTAVAASCGPSHATSGGS